MPVEKIYREVRDTPIYIFDESSSNMDSDSEEMFINLINEYLSLKTVIVISHREKFKNYVDKHNEQVFKYFEER